MTYIERWLQSGQNQCPQCRKLCGQNTLIKLYFSEGESENNLVRELEEKNWKLQASKLIAVQKTILKSQYKM